jgi:L-cysteine S-thiosulfotransferase
MSAGATRYASAARVFCRLWFLALVWPCGLWAAEWPTSPKLSGNAFLTPGLLKLQNDAQNSPVSLWLDKGAALWSDTSNGPSCQSCHGAVETLKKSAPSFPRITRAKSSDKATASPSALINLEDQITACSARGGREAFKAEEDEVLALSALLHNAAKGLPIDIKVDVKAPAEDAALWQSRLSRGTQLFSTRLGRINLACVHCHDQNVGRQMRLDVVSPGHPTGFPIYRMSWQRLGSVERRLRACYSGVQAVLPAPGDADLRDLELYLKVRANGMLIDGPSVRR